MKLSEELLCQLSADLAIDKPFVKGRDNAVMNCWHFCTDGNCVDLMFYDEQDFRDGMNRVFLVSKEYSVKILAFVLMDNHVHFILHGSFEECNRFIHAFVKQTSMAIRQRHNASNKLIHIRITHQCVDTDFYLKTVICYVVKNPSAAGIPCLSWEYPWSSGGLYFSKGGRWTSPMWTESNYETALPHSCRGKRELFKTNRHVENGIKVMDGIIFPGEYVAFELVERLFKTPRSFEFFMGITKEESVESKGGMLSRITIPDRELRQRKNEICFRLFGTGSAKTLGVSERLRIARELHREYRSSKKQIARVVGLVYGEVKELL